MGGCQREQSTETIQIKHGEEATRMSEKRFLGSSVGIEATLNRA